MSVSYSFGNLHNILYYSPLLFLESLQLIVWKKGNLHSILANNRFASTFFLFYLPHFWESENAW